MTLNWKPIETAPIDGTPIVAECVDGENRYIASVVFWTLEMLLKHGPDFKKGDEYWSVTHDDFACEPVRWLEDFEMPSGVEVRP